MISNSFEQFNQKSYELRKRFLTLFVRLGFGHITSAFSITEILVMLYYNVMRYQVDNPNWQDRDRLVMSKGHGAGMLFPIFEDVGFFSKEDMEAILKIGGKYTDLKPYFYPGFEFYGGSLGIGLGLACGLAKGAKLNRQDWITFCIVGDAECYEGAIWEAAMFAGHQRLNNLVAIVDRNALGCSDFTENMLALEPFANKWKACNWDTIEVAGHDYTELYRVLSQIRTLRSQRPLCIIANTVKGNGLQCVENIPLMHGYMPTKDIEIEQIFQDLEKWHNSISLQQ